MNVIAGDPTPTAPPKRALIVRVGALGDLLLLRNTIASFKRVGFEAALLAPAYPAQALLGAGMGDVDHVFDWGSPEISAFLASHEARGALRAFLSPCDCAVVYSRQTSLSRALLREIPRVISRPVKPHTNVHAAEWYTAAVRDLGLNVIAADSCRANIGERDQAATWLERLPASFLAVHAGSGSRSKNWAASRFMRTAEIISAGRPFLLIEGPAEQGNPAPVVGQGTAVVASCLPLRVLGALLSHAGVFVGNDSGVTHLAAAWGAPTVALFGPTDPAVYSPPGRNVSVVRAPGSDLKALSVDAVVDAIRVALRISRPYRPAESGHNNNAETQSRRPSTPFLASAGCEES